MILTALAAECPTFLTKTPDFLGTVLHLICNYVVNKLRIKKNVSFFVVYLIQISVIKEWQNSEHLKDYQMSAALLQLC